MLNVFFTLRFARPPVGVPVMAKYAVVVAFAGTIPDASTMAG